MQHREFIEALDSHQRDWQLTNWALGVRITLGNKALLLIQVAQVSLLAPAVLLAAYSVYSNRFALLIPAVAGFCGYYTRSTRPTGIGMIASMIVAIAVFVAGVLAKDPVLACASLLPGVIWFGSCAILGTATDSVIDVIRSSEACFQELVRRGILTFGPSAERSHARSSPMEQDFNGPYSTPSP
jgi:hypothetical protein